MADENLRLRAALRDLVALSTIPAGWIGIEPRTIATGLADILAGSLNFDFAFVRLLDPTGGLTIDVTSGCATAEFLDWLQAQLSTLDESLRQPIVPNDVGLDDGLKSLRGIIVPIGFNAYAGLVAVGCERSDFPTETDRMLLTVAVNHAATAFRSANLIHERRRAEEEVRKARDQLEMKVMERTAELQRTMAELTHMNRVATAGVLSASIAHEVNQPLMAIVTNAETCLLWLAKDQPDLVEARQAAERIITSGRRAGDILDNVRSMVRQSASEMKQLDVNELIEDILGLIRAELRRHDIALKTEFFAGLGPVTGNRVQLQQVVLNLVVNGIEALGAVEHGPRSLRVSSELDGEGNAMVAVEDSGTGVDPTKIDRIFEPLFTTKRDGMGMGLSICRSIVEAHGGRLWASPRKPRGSIFRFTLPSATNGLSVGGSA
jgi:signal transduction histidine kinase